MQNRFLLINASSLVANQFHEIGISSNSGLLPSPAPLLWVKSQYLKEKVHSTPRIDSLASGTEICSEGRNAMTVRHVCLQTGDGIHVQVREDLAKKLQSKAYM